MFKGGLLPAPIIQPLKFDTIGTRIHIGPDTFIEIRTDVAGTRIYFTTDGTKPDPFQTGRTGKASTHKYIGPFRLQLGNRCVRAICVSRDRLRSSQVSTKYIDVVLPPSSSNVVYLSDHQDVSSTSDNDSSDEPLNNNNIPKIKKSKSKQSLQEQLPLPLPLLDTNISGSLEGPINPINYSGTQINVWGFPPGGADLANLLQTNTTTKEQTHLGPITDQMIKDLNTPRPKPKEEKPQEPKLSESVRKLSKQIQRMYERDTHFQNSLDKLIENSQVKSGKIDEKHDSFHFGLVCSKYEPDPEPPKPKPPIINKPIITRPPSPPPVIKEKSPPPKPKPIETTKPIVKPTPPPPKKESEEPNIYVEELQQQGTLVDAPNFNAEQDAEALNGALKGLGTREETLIDIMGNRSSPQRLKIKDMYKLMFGKELSDDLKSDTSGNFEKLLTGLCMSPIEYDCMEMRKAMKGLGTDDSTLIEILTSRSNKRLKEISALYLQLYKKKLEDAIVSDTSGNYRKLLVSILNGGRSETNQVDMNLVKSDSDELMKAGIKKFFGTDESKFHLIFATRSFAHLRQMFIDYESKAKQKIEDSIKSEMSGNTAKAYIALVNNIKSRCGYFAREIKKAMKGLGTDEHTLNRIIISRCEVDMKQIKEEYQKLFGISMEADLGGDVSGDYGKLLLRLVLDPNSRSYTSTTQQPQVEHVIEIVEEPLVEETPTLREFIGFNSKQDCDDLRKAMKGLGTDEKTLVRILCNRSLKQRLQLKSDYKSFLGRDLVKDLIDETSSDFKESLEALMMSQDEFDAFSFHKAIAGLGTDESAIVELLTTRTAEQLIAAKKAYEKMYGGKSLEADIKSDTSGAFMHCLVSLLTAMRPTGNTVDVTQAKLDAQELMNAGAKKWGTDESKFVKILCIRSFAQLRATFVEYSKLSGKSLEDDLKKECSGDLLRVFLGIIECVKDKQTYFASCLLKAMKGLGTKESTVIRVIVSRCEIDMVQIKRKFETMAKQSLGNFLKGDLSGDFLKTMMTLIGEGDLVQQSSSTTNTTNTVTSKPAPIEQPQPIIPPKDHVIEKEAEQALPETPTLLPYASFNPLTDCEQLRKAMKGWGTDEKTIINIIAKRSLKQRLELINVYKTSIGRDLLFDFKDETSGHFKDTLECLLMTSDQLDAYSFNKAIAGLGTDESAIIELLVTRTNEQINAAKSAYQTMFKKSLENDVKGDTSGTFRNVLVSLLNAQRPNDTMIDRTQAQQDAQMLVTANKDKKFSPDKSIFIDILCVRSFAQLRATFDEYQKASGGKSLEDDLKKECSGDLLRVFLGIVECVKDKQSYFASCLLNAMKGLGTKETSLIRIIISRCEIDMVQIKQKFETIAKETLVKALKGDCSGDFLRMLLTLIGEESQMK